MNTGINISINNVCNNNCSYCFQSTYNNKSEKKYITLEHYNFILNFLKNSSINHINLLGGEPTLHPELLQIIDDTLNKNYSVLLISNLLVQDEEYFSQIAQKDIGLLVNATQTDKNRPLFERNLQTLLNFKGPNKFGISFCLTGNKEEDDRSFEYMEFLSQKFNDYNLRFRISPASPNDFKTFKIINYSDHYKKIQDMLSKYNNTFNFDCTLNYCQIDYSTLDNLFVNDCEFNEIIRKFSTRCCGALDILLDDKLYFCNSLRNIGVDIFKYKNFDEAYAELILKISEVIDSNIYKYCDPDCQKKNYCIGPCPAQFQSLKIQHEND